MQSGGIYEYKLEIVCREFRLTWQALSICIIDSRIR